MTFPPIPNDSFAFLMMWLYNHFHSKSINIVHEYGWLFWYILHKFDCFMIIWSFLIGFSHFFFIFLHNSCFKMIKKYWYKKQYASLYQYQYLFLFYSLFYVVTAVIFSNITIHAVVLTALTKMFFPEKWFLQEEAAHQYLLSLSQALCYA